MVMTEAPRAAQDSRGRELEGEVTGGHGRTPSDRARWEPLEGDALLGRLRATGRPRLAADRPFVAGLRGFLDRALIDGEPFAMPEVEDGAPVVFTKERLTRALTCPQHAADIPAARTFSVALACGALVGVLFRQWVTVGAIDDPLAESLDGLATCEFQAPLVEWIRALPAAEQAGLRAEVERQADGIRRRWPLLDPAWLPRTQEVLRVPVLGDRGELSVRVDLAIGRPAGDEASVALVGVTSGMRRPAQRHDAHLAALAEALRSGVPPFAVATYFTRTGEFDVDPVTPELLCAAAERLVTGVRIVTGMASMTTDPMDARWCAGCAADPLRLPMSAAAAIPPPRVGRPPLARSHDAASHPVGPPVALPTEWAA